MAGPRQYSMSNNTAANDITGDRIQTKGVLSDQGRKNFDNIDWGKRAREAAKETANTMRDFDEKLQIAKDAVNDV